MSKIAKVILLVLISFVFVVPVSAVYKKISDAPSVLDTVSGQTGLDTKSDISKKIGGLIQVALGLVGLAFLILMFYGGYRWLTSRGNEEEIKKGLNTIIAALTGLFIILASYGVTYFLVNRITTMSPTEPPTATEQEPIGCCFDQVKVCDDSAINVHLPRWANRGVTTQSDCQTAGEKTDDVNDCQFGPGTWQFKEGITDMPACEELFKKI